MNYRRAFNSHGEGVYTLYLQPDPDTTEDSLASFFLVWRMISMYELCKFLNEQRGKLLAEPKEPIDFWKAQKIYDD